MGGCSRRLRLALNALTGEGIALPGQFDLHDGENLLLVFGRQLLQAAVELSQLLVLDFLGVFFHKVRDVTAQGTRKFVKVFDIRLASGVFPTRDGDGAFLNHLTELVLLESLLVPGLCDPPPNPFVQLGVRSGRYAGVREARVVCLTRSFHMSPFKPSVQPWIGGLAAILSVYGYVNLTNLFPQWYTFSIQKCQPPLEPFHPSYLRSPLMTKYAPADQMYVFQLNNEEFETSDATLTGSQIKAIAGVDPTWIVFQPQAQGQDRHIDDQAVVNLAPKGVEHLYVLPPEGLTDRQHYRFQVDQDAYEIPRPQVTGAEIRRIAAIPIEPKRDLYLERDGKPDKSIGDADVVDLTPRGTEHLYTMPEASYGEGE